MWGTKASLGLGASREDKELICACQCTGGLSCPWLTGIWREGSQEVFNGNVTSSSTRRNPAINWDCPSREKHSVNDAVHGNGSFSPKEQLQPPAWPCPATFPRPHAAWHFVVFSSLFFLFNYCLYRPISALQLSQAETFSAASAPRHSWSH